MTRFGLCSCILALTLVWSASSSDQRAGGRRGIVSLDGHALSDAAGPFNALGASLFWALWGERHDSDRLDANLEFLAARGVDFVRVLGMVGTETWSDRRVDPEAGDYWRTVDRLLERLARHGLRAEVTLFADAQTMMPDARARQRFADAWAERAEDDPERFMFLEIANEHWKNGLEDVDELRALGRRVADRTRVLVALSAARPEQMCTVYAGSAARLATVHYDRGERSSWGFVLLPWQWPAAFDRECRGRLPVAVNNEPTGPGSSVSAEADPRRLTMAYLSTFISQNAAYVLHAGPGVRGGGRADLALGRVANFFDMKELDRTLEGIRYVRRYVPPGLANWNRHAPDQDSHPLNGLATAVDRGLLAGAFAATSSDQFVVALSGLRRSVTAYARHACRVEVHDPVNPVALFARDLSAGDPLTLEGAEALIVTGRYRAD